MLTTKQRQTYFDYLGLGTYNKDNILKVQKKYFPQYTDKKNNWDGVYGSDTDKLVVNLYRVKKYAPHFKVTEFKCHCNGKYCNGYPAYLSIDLLKNVEKVRVKFGVTNVQSGMRCKTWNSKQSGSASQSRHIDGKAVDISGSYTKTSKGRAAVKSYWYTLSKANYSYYGTANMGTSVHCDVK